MPDLCATRSIDRERLRRHASQGRKLTRLKDPKRYSQGADITNIEVIDLSQKRASQCTILRLSFVGVPLLLLIQLMLQALIRMANLRSNSEEGQ